MNNIILKDLLEVISEWDIVKSIRKETISQKVYNI